MYLLLKYLHNFYTPTSDNEPRSYSRTIEARFEFYTVTIFTRKKVVCLFSFDRSRKHLWNSIKKKNMSKEQNKSNIYKAKHYRGILLILTTLAGQKKKKNRK